MPNFEGDDLRRLVNEIKKAMQYLKQAITFNRMYSKQQNFDEGKQKKLHSTNIMTQKKKETLIWISLTFFNRNDNRSNSHQQFQEATRSAQKLQPIRFYALIKLNYKSA